MPGRSPKRVRPNVELAEPRWSHLKPAEKFQRMWDDYGSPQSDLVTEHVFSDERKYRLDFAWPSLKVGVEIHGFGWGHQAQQHLAADCEKQRHALRHGWLIIPFTTRCISSRERCKDAVEFVLEFLGERWTDLNCQFFTEPQKPADTRRPSPGR